MGKRIKKIISKIVDLKSNLVNSIIYFVYYYMPIKSNLVYVESKGGEDLAGNMLRIVEELEKPLYGNMKFVFFVKLQYREKIRKLLDTYKITSYKFVANSLSAGIIMERAKFLFTDADLRPRYVKREGQVLVNTWHGTPQKHMGRKNSADKIGVGTLQRINLLSDYLVFPSKYMAEVIMQDYMIANISPAKILWEGYPRNCIFFNGTRRKELIEKFNLINKKIYVYMPTYRGNWWTKNKTKQVNIMVEYLKELDQKMNEDQILFVKLHLYGEGNIDYDKFAHIFKFPSGYETYDILNMADCLITDYSSVFFDFANTKRKIILFTYDEEEYFADRGVYFPLSSFPFPNVKTVDELILEMNTEKKYDDTDFRQRFCTYDNKDATERLCRHIVLQEDVCIEGKLANGKENVLIFGGSLNKNGITMALINLLKNIDKEKRNYYLALRKDDIKVAPQRLNILSDDIEYLIMDHSVNRTLLERFDSQRYSKNRDIELQLSKRLKRLYLRAWDSYYKNVNFSHLIQFDGYGIDINLMYLMQSVKRTIIVHNDMMREIATKSWQHPATLRLCYAGYDNVGVVSADLISSTIRISQREDNIMTINNYHNTDEVCTKSELPIEFQKETEIQCFRPGGVEWFLNQKGPKFISIGRFSSEKGHFRLLNSFNRFWQENPEAVLIIIGGYGALHGKTIKKARNLPCWKNVAIIKSLENPMPILKRCDLFILASEYEGLPMTIKEAETLGIPVLSTKISSLQQFAKEYKLYQVEASETGVYRGMVDFLKGRIGIMGIDFNTYNVRALEEFEKIFEK